MEMPRNLQAAIEEELGSSTAKGLSTQAAELSKRYRTGKSAGEKGSFFQSKKDITAYAAFRMPATYAAVFASLTQVKLRLPNWNVHSLLDVGAGPGTATWAAAEVWPDIKGISLLERESEMIELGKRLASQSERDALKQAKWQKVDLMDSWQSEKHDLVIVSYSLGEWPERSRESLLQRLWDITSGALVIIEPGTPEGYARILKARDQLMAEGANTIAPCPHNKACPLTGEDWCHFSQRISRSRMHRQVKGAELSFEDEKFSFVCLSRMNREELTGRVIRHPQVRKGHIRLDVCSPDGIRHMVVTRKKKEQFRIARNLDWGDAITEPLDG